jgi:hypothetical protein
MADSSLLITGGHIIDAVGEKKAVRYHAFTNSWSSVPDMNAGRWYPTNVTLANGEVLVMAGTYTNTIGVNGVNLLPQVWPAAGGAWRNLTTANLDNLPTYADYYPFLYLAPNGKVFNAGPQQMARYLDTSGAGTWSDVDASTLLYRDYGSSVMYDEGKVLIVGGNPRDDLNNPTIVPSASAEVIDLNAATPTWRQVNSMSIGRRHLNTTLMPDGQVLVTGGSSLPGFDEPAGAVLYAEMWNPVTEDWTDMANYSQYRGYHSTALLLPDGRVLIGGGGHPNPSVGAQHNFEIYSPPYLFKGPRPHIEGFQAWVDYAEIFFIKTPDAASIDRVNWIRLSAVTHAYNQNQRINRLNFQQTPGGLQISAPAEANLAPPGYYILFILNGSGAPSLGQIMRLGPHDDIFLPVILKAANL